MHSLPELMQPQPMLAAFDLLGWITQAVYACMITLFSAIVTTLTVVTNPDLDGTGFQTQFAIMKTIALYLLVPMMLAATIMAILRGSLAKMLQMFFVAVPAAVIGAPISILFIRLLEAIDVNFTDAVTSSMLNPALQFTTEIQNNNEVIGGLADLRALSVMLIGSLIMIVALIFLGLELAFRAVMLSVGALFLPFALAMAVWEPARRFLVTLIETICVLVFSHFICVTIFFFGISLSVNGLNQSDLAANVEHVVIGGVVAIMACTALPALLTFVLGSSPATRMGHQDIIQQSSLSMATGAADVRKMAVKGFMDNGKKLGKVAKSAKSVL